MPAIRVYKYGLLTPITNEVVVRDQMRAAHNYRNTLVEIERGRRAAIRGAIVLTAKRRQVMKEDSIKREIARIDELAKELRKGARAVCNCYWGSYQIIEDADNASRKQPYYDGIEPNDPAFVRWQNSGHVSVQLQGGMTAKELFSGTDRRVHIANVDERAWYGAERKTRRFFSRTTLSIRVGSDGRDPVWAEFPMIMHRALPEGAIIKRITASMHSTNYYGGSWKSGDKIPLGGRPHEKWSCEMTLEIPDTTPLRPKTGQVGFIAIDIGWRVIGDEVRVASWCDHLGDKGELRLPPRVMSGLDKADSIRSIRDDKFNIVRDILSKNLKAMVTPEWMERDVKTIHTWRSPARLVRLIRKWSENRFPSDSEMFEYARAWLGGLGTGDEHLWRMETGLRQRTILWRREIYRQFASFAARKYKMVILESEGEDTTLMDLTKFARNAPVEKESPENKTARGNRHRVAVGELRLCLVNAFAGNVGYVPTMNTTRTCHICGLVEAFDAANELVHTCSGCQSAWDQDENAAIILCMRWKSGGGSSGEKEVKEGRWTRAKRLAEEKRLRA